MLALAVIALGVAVCVGSGLALWHMRPMNERPKLPGWVGMAHGAVGALGLGALSMVLQGPARGLTTGTAAFGWASAVLLTAALLAGLTIPMMRRLRLLSSTAIVIHGVFAITGFAIFLAWASFD